METQIKSSILGNGTLWERLEFWGFRAVRVKTKQLQGVCFHSKWWSGEWAFGPMGHFFGPVGLLPNLRTLNLNLIMSHWTYHMVMILCLVFMLQLLDLTRVRITESLVQFQNRSGAISYRMCRTWARSTADTGTAQKSHHCWHPAVSLSEAAAWLSLWNQLFVLHSIPPFVFSVFQTLSAMTRMSS